MLLQLVLTSLTAYQIALIGWILGAIFSLVYPFYLKVRKGKLFWSDFNYGYVVNFIITIITGVGASLLIFAVWIIPEGSQLVVLVTAFLMAAGFDQEVIIRVLGKLGLYQALYDRVKPG